jgi:hypothetical protein
LGTDIHQPLFIGNKVKAGEKELKKIPDIPVNRNSGMTISGIRE